MGDLLSHLAQNVVENPRGVWETWVLLLTLPPLLSSPHLCEIQHPWMQRVFSIKSLMLPTLLHSHDTRSDSLKHKGEQGKQMESSPGIVKQVPGEFLEDGLKARREGR